MGGMESPDVSELIRRLENLLRPGTIDQVDVAGALVRVRHGGLISAWVKWFARRAGTVREWSPPSVGEQCLLLSPGGDPANSVALVGLFSDDIPPNDNRATTEATRFPDGSLAEYDHAAHQALLQCVGTVLVQAQKSITLDAATELSATAGTEVTVQSGAAMTLKATGALVIESATSISLKVGSSEISISDAGISGTPDIVMNGISLVKHAHDKVREGTDISGMPV